MRRMGARIGATILLAALATPALAAGVLPIGGAFGNPGGCHYFATGDVPNDDFALLTPDTFASYGTACDFEALVSTENGVFIIRATCQAEGEEGAGPDHLKVIDHGVDGYGVQFEGLEEWGPYKACPPAGPPPSSEVA